MALFAHASKRADDVSPSLGTASWLSIAAADGPADEPVKPALAAADFLSLAAAPTFAIMALLTAVTGSADTICTTTSDAFPIGGMVPMYLLMSAFHLAPWLGLASRLGLGCR
ncbi:MULTISPECIES: hypothetical protein [Rhizobium]|uniref:hypothetical protein n=1 Tax=Rhizobium TaxID=379 RepID=UPI001B3316B9|nr:MULTISPECIES: hypothetical protein [Rhizobium]MBX4906059.1 hypothetical protein [Rhizobium bangladeshense]MBX5212915.1 hypothetical protein [Rhizobium sp. NLR9a]MBX5225562.1 hypothetical protein [Rhizobium sp. NLR9b]MBX5231376.1 hypothetical protein [Rhizobium sp. NLR4a]MBX5243184.1 hypothetical protein [Rhizobium sp. NLR3b]